MVTVRKSAAWRGEARSFIYQTIQMRLLEIEAERNRFVHNLYSFVNDRKYLLNFSHLHTLHLHFKYNLYAQ